MQFLCEEAVQRDGKGNERPPRRRSTMLVAEEVEVVQRTLGVAGVVVMPMTVLLQPKPLQSGAEGYDDKRTGRVLPVTCKPIHLRAGSEPV
jgi:hypothetical protein